MQIKISLDINAVCKVFSFDNKYNPIFGGREKMREVIISILICCVFLSGCIQNQNSGKGDIQVTSSPRGAEVYLDNGYRGTTPTTIKDVSFGSHTIEFRYQGYQSWSTGVSVTSGTSQLQASLTPISQPTIQTPPTTPPSISPLPTQLTPTQPTTPIRTPAQTIQHTRFVAVTASQRGNDIEFTYQGGGDASSVTSLICDVLSSDGRTTKGSTTNRGYSSPLPVGSTITLMGYGTSGRDHITCSAVFIGGDSELILDAYI